jgi:transcriptional regulator with XRE-family HTH domain
LKIPRTKEWRESQGLTQRELADEAGVVYTTVARIEVGHAVNPSTARKIAKALGITVADLIERPPVPLSTGPLPRLDPWSMLGVPNPEQRAAALEAATNEERGRYLAELEAAAERCALAITQVAADLPAAPDERAARAIRLDKLLRLRDAYTVLLNEVEPIAFPEPQMASELIPA